MATPHAIRRLYENVLNYEKEVNDVSDRDIRAGVRSLAHVYAPPNSNFLSADTNCANFNDPACRCAYLHKNAPLHTYVVQDTIIRIFQEVPNYLRNLLLDSGPFRICSLGGGPGSDALGVVTALLFAFGPFRPSVTIVDSMRKWEDTVALMMLELTVRPLDGAWSYVDNCQWHYLECDLLGSMTNEVNKSIATASLITMVKFVSAAICTETENMVDKIFRVVKPGALVLFIDNAAGGFSQIIERSGKRNGLVAIYGPMRHVVYEEQALKIERFGYTSCFKTTVTIILLQKSTNKGNLHSLPTMKTNQNDSFPKSHNPIRNSEATGKTSAVGMSQKPLPMKTNQNGGFPKSPSAVSNASGLLPRCLLKPTATATAQTKSDVPNFTDQKAFSIVDLHRTPLIDGDNSPGSSFARTGPIAVVPPKFPTTYRYPTSPNSSLQLIPEPFASIWNFSPIAGERNRPPSEVEDNPEETGCSWRSISVDGDNSPNSSFARTRPTAVVPPKFPTTYRYPTSKNSSLQLIPEPCASIRNYPPIAGERNRPPSEVEDDPKETGCSCCSIS